MRREFIVALACTAMLGCGFDPFEGPLVISQMETLKVLQGTTYATGLHAYSRDGFPVSFSLRNAPAFVRLESHLQDRLVLEPTRDSGEFTFFVVAKAGPHRSEQRVAVRVIPNDTPPELKWMAFSEGAEGTSCFVPSHYDLTPIEDCERPYVTFLWIDTTQDAARVDVEVVEQGQPFTRIPTVSASYDADYDAWSQSGFRCLHIPGLESGRAYVAAGRVAQQNWPDETGMWADWVGGCTQWIAP